MFERETQFVLVTGVAPGPSVDAYVLDRLAAAPDHPQTVCFPEGEYLKGLVLLKK